MESIGAKLKKIRLEKGLSLDDVHKKTKIDLNILRSIEEDSLLNFSPVYIKGFLKIYCQSLGVEPNDYIPDYKAPRNIVEEFSEVKEKPKVFLRTEAALKLIKRVAIILTAVLFITGLFKFGKYVSQPKINKKVTSKPQVTQPALPKASSFSDIRLTILAKDNCWIKLKSDGKVVFQNTLKKGRSESWQAKEKIELSLSDARAVDLQVNEKLITNLGRKGMALKNIIITKDGLTVPQ